MINFSKSLLIVPTDLLELDLEKIEVNFALHVFLIQLISAEHFRFFLRDDLHVHTRIG